eukprot:6897405-Karenia_brevis.AAC.1
MPDSANGVDGIPYSAYQACVCIAAYLFWKILTEMANFGVCVSGFKFELLAFVPKKPSDKKLEF